MEIFVDRPGDVRAVLADPGFVPVPPLPDRAGAPGSMAWLRAAVARFSHGPDHARRRALVEAELAAIDPERLRSAAARSARPAGEVAVAVLAEALGVRDVDAAVAAVPAVAAVYLAPGDAAAERAADEAVAALVPLLHPGFAPETGAAAQSGFAPGSGAAAQSGFAPGTGPEGERLANRIGLLVQAYAATAGLVRAAVGYGSVVDALRDEPPVRSTRRVATVDTTLGGTEVAAGATVVVDLAAAGLPFGGEPRICPGRAHALAIAAGVLHATTPTGVASREAEQGGVASEEAELKLQPRWRGQGDPV